MYPKPPSMPKAVVDPWPSNMTDQVTHLAGVGRTTETVKDNADDIAGLAGAGRTVETVKDNADDIATHIGLETGIHGATAAATAGKIVQRGAKGEITGFMPRASVTRMTGQDVESAAVTPLAYVTVGTDNDGMTDEADKTKITIKTSGVYVVTATVNIVGTAGGSLRQALLSRYGTGLIVAQASLDPTNANGFVNLAYIGYMAADEYLVVSGAHVAAGVTLAYTLNNLDVVRVG